MVPARYWEKPNEFIPERFLGDWDRDAFLAFSVGGYKSCSERISSEKSAFPFQDQELVLEESERFRI